MAIKQQHFIPAELADWQTPVEDKDLTTSPESPSNGDKYIIAGTGGDWSAGTINDIVWYINDEWFFITPAEGMQVYLKDENIYYFYNGSVWGTLGGSGDMSKSTYDTSDVGIVDKAQAIDDNDGNTASASELVKNIYNVVLLAFKVAVQGSLTVFNMIDGIVDEYEDESGIDTVNSANQSYDSTDDYYSPSSSGTIGTSPYAHYKCNDNAGNTTVTDDGTGSNNGTSSTNTNNLSATGKINQAFEFNGSSEYIDIDALRQDIDSDSVGSFSFWFKTTSDVDGDYIATFSDTLGSWDYLGFYAYDNGTDLQVILYGKWGYDVSITANEWHHLVLSQNGTEVKLYIDSVLKTRNDSTDITAWFEDLPNIDNGYLGAENRNGSGLRNYFDGLIDDFRYYKIALTSTHVSALYNSGSGTEDDDPAIAFENMTLISDLFTAESQPNTGRIVVFEEDVDAITINTDLKAYISRDDGSTWAETTLEDEGDYDAFKRILVGSVDLSLSGIGSGTDMVYKIVTDNEKQLKIHGTALLWD